MGGIMEILLLLGLVGGGAGLGAWFGFGGNEIDKVLEVRPVGATAMAAGTTMPEDLAEKARLLPGVSKVVKFLHISRGIGTTAGPRLAIAGEFSGTSFPTFGKVRIQEGRALRAEDAGTKVAVVGKLVAEEYASAGQGSLPVGGTIELQGSSFEVVGIFTSKTPLLEQQVLIPLTTAQQTLGVNGQISGFLVTVKRAKHREAVAEALRAALEESADVMVPRKWEKQLAGRGE